MPLIDRSYFVDELNIARTDQVDVQIFLDSLIQKRETELLKDILSYPLYKSFLAGLAVDPVDPIWTNLLLGAEYTDRFSRLQYWRGLVSAPPALINATDQSNQIDYVAIQSDVDSQTIPVPTTIIGRTWTIAKRPIGQLRTDEYDIGEVQEDGSQSVAFTTAIALNDTYFFYCNNLSLEQSTGDIKQSLIANYVYYWYNRAVVSNASATGNEVVPNMENSIINGAHVKMQRAWNEMTSQIYELIDFLDSNRTIYTDWKWNYRYRILENYRHICRF